MKDRKTVPVLAAGVLLAAVTLAPWAEAHYLWVETPPAGDRSFPSVAVYYGEFEEGLREVAGGRLDEVGAIQAWVTGAAGTRNVVACKKRNDHFDVTLPAAAIANPALVQVQELGRAVQDWRKYDIGIVKPAFYASALHAQPADANTLPHPAVRTTLAIDPVRLGDDLVVQVFFHDAPLPHAKVNVHAPNGWSKELKTDDDGIARLALPWPGQYVVEVIHLEKTPGEFQGVPYEAVRHRATFSWQVTQDAAGAGG